MVEIDAQLLFGPVTPSVADSGNHRKQIQTDEPHFLPFILSACQIKWWLQMLKNPQLRS